MARGSMQKYFSEEGGDAHGGALTWPGTREGFPLRGPVPKLLTPQEVEKIKHEFDYKSRLFDMANADDQAAYNDVQERILIGWYALRKRIDKWQDHESAPRIWLEWVQIYGSGASLKKSNGVGTPYVRNNK